MDIKKIRVILLVCIFIVFGIIFKFSSENSTKSTSTSGTVINAIVDTHPVTKDLNEYQKQSVKVKLTTPVRKMAHFTIYMILGVLLMCFANTYDTHILKKVLVSLAVGTFYACTDEFHQMFVSGRSSEITDVGIDTLGVVLGILLVIFQIKLVNWVKTFMSFQVKAKKSDKIM